MKFFKLLALVIVLILALPTINARACEFNFKITTEEKKSYKIGEELVVAVTVTLTHRNCHEDVNNIKFDMTGVKALGATPWKDLGNGQFERKFKLQVTDDPKGKHLLSATRSCDKDGGSGSVKIAVQ